MKDLFSRYQAAIIVVLFFVIGALVYLPLSARTGYYDDDWFAMYAAKIDGPQVFREFYVLDSRPGRALVTIPLHMLFKGVPFYYAISAYIFRVLGSLVLWWLLRILWPNHRKETFLAALLFLIYPGFLSMPTPVDFQTHLVGIGVAFLSLGLSVKALHVSSYINRFFLWGGAVLSGLFYLAQMEYYIGFEIIRILLLIMLFLRRDAGWKQNLMAAFKYWLPYMLIPVVFLVWRLIFFESSRKVTDAALQLSRLTETPLHTSARWLILLAQDVVNVTLLAWSVPLSQLTFNLDLYNSVVAIALSIAVLILFFAVFLLAYQNNGQKAGNASGFEREALWLGLAWVVFGLLPVVMGNRHVIFPEFSRYGFVSAGGAVLFLVAVIGQLSGQTFQRVVIALLLISATLTHYANTVRFAAQMDNIRSFWWQVSWRVPQFDKGTTLIAHYPVAAIREPSFVWGPANQIYFPTRTKPGDIVTGISAIRLDRATVLKILNKEKQYMDPYYMVTAYPNPRHFVILTQPTPQSCVQLIDGAAPEYSTYEDPLFIMVGSYSETEKILTQVPAADVPETLFGEEPEHNWCYYYEKAALARQLGKWDEILQLADDANQKNLKPHDLIEWMPFLQAYALNDRTDGVIRVLNEIQSDEYVSRQACQRLSSLQTSSDIQNLISTKYCLIP